MGFTAEALAPTFLLIALGYVLGRTPLIPHSFWPGAERLTYFILFPCLLFGSVARAPIDLGELLAMAVTLPAGVGLVSAAMLLGRRAFPVDGPGFSSIFQGAVRPNTYVGLAIVAALFGEEGVTLAAVGIALVIPLVNTASVLVLVRYGRLEDMARRPHPLRSVVTNPLIVAVILGGVANLVGLGHLPVVDPIMKVLGDSSLPIGLLAVGAGLDLPAVRRSGRWVGIATAIKLVAVPAVTAAIGLALGLDGLPLTVALLYNGLPTSASSYVLARLMGGDAAMLAGIITATTLAAIATIPIIVLLTV